MSSITRQKAKMKQDDVIGNASSTSSGQANNNKDDNNNNNEDEDEDDEEEMMECNPEDADRLTLLPQPPPPPKKYVPPNARNKKKEKTKKRKSRRLLLSRDHYDIARAAAAYHRRTNSNDNDDNDNDDYEDPDSLDSILRPLWLGVGLFLVLFPFWILDTLKDPVFGILCSGKLELYQPTAKLLSVCMTVCLVLFLEYLSHEQAKSKQQQQKQQAAAAMIMMNNNNNTAKQQPEQQQHQQQQQQQEQQIATIIERPAIDVLDGGGHWTRMETTSSSDYYHHYNYESSSEYFHESLQDQESARVPSTIFASMGIPYCIAFAIMAYLLQFNRAMDWKSTTTTTTGTVVDYPKSNFWHVLGYFWYASIESFGSLQVATFWSFTNSTLSLRDAERYYGYIISMAQLGAILGSTMVTTHIWSSVTLTVASCMIIILHIVVMILYSRRFPATSKPLSKQEKIMQEKRKKQQQLQKLWLKNNNISNGTSSVASSTYDLYEDTLDPTFWSGIYLILKHNYVLLILGVSCLYEVSLTCLNYQMTLLGWSRFEENETVKGGGGVDTNTDGNTRSMTFAQFMGHYGQMVNVSSLVLSAIVFPLLIKGLGLRRTLWIFPTLLLAANLMAFIAMPGNLTVLFFAMALLKAMTYSIHDPSKEILYNPTSNAIKYKSKFWIDVVGARFAKAVGSAINARSGSVHRSIKIASAPSLLTAAALWVACYRAGNTFEELVESGHTVGLTNDELDPDGYNSIIKTDQNLYDHNDDDDQEDEKQADNIGEGNVAMELTAV